MNPHDSWQMTRLPRIEQSSTPHLRGSAQLCCHLRYSSHGPKSIPCCTGLSKPLFQYTPACWVTRLISLHMERATVGLPNASPSPTISWDGNPRSAHVLPPHLSKMGPLHWWNHIIKWRLVSAIGHSANFARTWMRERMSSDITERLRPRHCHMVWGFTNLPRSDNWQDSSLSNSWERKRGASFCEDFRVLGDFYSPVGTMHSSLSTAWCKKGTRGTGDQRNKPPTKRQNTSENKSKLWNFQSRNIVWVKYICVSRRYMGT